MGLSRPANRSAGTGFAYSSVPVVVVEKAAEALENPDLRMALYRLMQTSEPTEPFIELLGDFRPPQSPHLVSTPDVIHIQYSLLVVLER
jgi:hypothetical protein